MDMFNKNDLNTSLERLGFRQTSQVSGLQKELKVQNQLFVKVAENDASMGYNFRTKSRRSVQSTIQSEINQLKREISQINSKIQQQQKLQQYKTLQVEKQQEKYNTLDKTIRQTNEEFTNVLDVIQQTSDKLEADVAQKQQRAMFQAMANYDYQKDGDFNTYFKNALQGVVPDSGLVQILQAMQNVPNEYISTLGNLSFQMLAINSSIKQAQNDISQITSNIKNLKTSKSAKQTRVKQLTHQMRFPFLRHLQRNEFAIMRYNKVNLNQQMNDGYSRFVLLMDNNNQFHLFDRQNIGMAAPYALGLNAPSYMQNNLSNYNMGVNMGNLQIGQGNQSMMYLDQFGQLNQVQAQYSYLPLSLDLNQDGLKLEDNKYTNFDINGDGQKELIKDTNDAVLVFDKDGDGISGKDGSETLGKYTDLDGDGVADGYKNGMEALRALAKKAGLDPDNGLSRNELKYLEKNYGLKVKTDGFNGEAKSLVNDLDIKSLNTSRWSEGIGKTEGIMDMNTDYSKTENITYSSARQSQYVNHKTHRHYNGTETISMGEIQQTETVNQNLGYTNLNQFMNLNLNTLNANDINNLEIAEMIAESTEKGMEVNKDIQEKLKKYNA